jgi:hypothetical protein
MTWMLQTDAAGKPHAIADEGGEKTHKDTDNFLVTVGEEPLNTQI